MFAGHYAAAFAAKRVAPRLSLGVLVAASQLIDLVWPLLLLGGVEHVRIAPGITRMTPLDFYHYPFTHSLAAVALWGVVAGAIVFAFRRRSREFFVVAGLVVSHWVLDAIVHRPDLPITFAGESRVGLGLWNSVLGSIGLEMGLLVASVVVYTRTTRALDRVGRYGWWLLVAFLAVIYVGNVFGPPPPSVDMLAGSALALWLTPVWAWWVDRHRTPVDGLVRDRPRGTVVSFTKGAARR